MNHTDNSAEKDKKIIGALIVITIVLMLHLQLFIQLYQHQRDIKKSSDILLSQVIEKIVTNDISEISLAADLRSEYILRANVFSYIVEKNPQLENNMDELLRVCRILAIDEVHFFNKQGEIYAGTVPSYYGMNFDSGEQIGYFKPMLNSKGMSMCQDPTPNTAEGKSMIYAIVWKRDGSGMIQIGVTPFRYFKEVNKNAISKTISEIPVDEGIDLFVIDRDTNQVIGCSHPGYIDKTYDELGIRANERVFFRTKFTNLEGKREQAYCRIRVYKNYNIILIESRKPFNRVLFLTLFLLLVYLCIAAAIIVYVLVKMNASLQAERDKRLNLQERMLKSLREQFSIIDGIGGDFEDIVLVNIEKKTASMLKRHGEAINYDSAKHAEGNPYEEVWNNYINRNVLPEDAEILKSKVELTHILTELSKKDEYYCTYRCNYKGIVTTLQVKFMKIHAIDSESNLFFFAIRNIDEIIQEQKRLVQLEKEARFDKLTGFYNRSSYEDDINSGSPKYSDESMVYLSMDVNGLKQTNDNYGHAKGDELLCGAAECMKLCFGSYGKLYRTGGDEFCGIIFADSLILDNLIKDFEETTNKWSLEHNLELAVSIGCADRKENKDISVVELSKQADRAMYYNKAQFYKNKGMDRRSEYRFSSGVSKS